MIMKIKCICSNWNWFVVGEIYEAERSDCPKCPDLVFIKLKNRRGSCMSTYHGGGKVSICNDIQFIEVSDDA